MEKKILFFRLGVSIVLLILVAGSIFYLWKNRGINYPFKPQAVNNGPAIVGGELVLPRVDLPLNSSQTGQSGQVFLENQLGVMSANLVGVFSQDNTASGSSQKLTGVRVLGELRNLGKNRINDFVPIVKFISDNGDSVNKVGRFTDNYSFFGLDGGEISAYDVTVEAPPSLSEKIEISLKAQESTLNPRRPVVLKIASRSAAIQPTETQQGIVDVYLVTGQVYNTSEFSVADISVLTYIKNSEGKVFGMAKQEFKSDLLKPGEFIPFKILVLPVKYSEIYDGFEVQAWGREYKI